MNDIKILIYEDNETLREAFSFLFQASDGFKVVGAFEVCTEIVQEMKELQPDVLLMDIDMPGMTGIEAVKLIKPKYPELNIMMVTVFDDDERVFESIKAGARGYLLKKTPPVKILESVREICEGGAPMSPSIARKVLQNLHSKPLHDKEIAQLTPRELEVLQLLAEGKSAKMVADICFISVETVRSHIKKIYEKLQVHSVTEALAKFNKR
jgi:DNA-binding NarL/FixJ family response regulator